MSDAAAGRGSTARTPVAAAVLSGVVPVLTALAVAVIVAWAAGSTRPLVQVDVARSTRTLQPRTDPAPQGTVATPSSRPSWARSVELAPLLRWVVVAVLVAILVAVCVRLAVAVAGRVRDLRRVPVPPTPQGRPVGLSSDDVQDAAARLQHGTPRNAIVAAWVRLEAVAADAGIDRQPTRTAADLATEIARTGAPPAPLHELNELYVRARFSDHPVDEGDRARAAELLTVVQRSLAQEDR